MTVSLTSEIENVPIVSESETAEEDQSRPRNEEDVSNEKVYTFDVGDTNALYMTSGKVKDAVQQGPQLHPFQFPDDGSGRSFPTYILYRVLTNGEKVQRYWLVWSKAKNALFCFPCRLLSKLSETNRSASSKPSGYSIENGWKKLYDRIPEHENSKNHRACYVDWREFQMRNHAASTVDVMLHESIVIEAARWRQILKRMLDVVLFIGERGLAFRGSNTSVGDPNNGNFLGILELISHYDTLLNEHLQRVKESRITKKRLQVHYLSPEIQNEFIECCANHVTRIIEKERTLVKYYAMIVDATPHSAHV